MNFKHLYYFWVTAKSGGIMRAGEQLHTTPQTLSGQIKLLEDWLGRQLFRKSGRQLELTEHGRLALGYADQIFSLGQDLETALRQARGTQRRLDFRVGVADSVSKSVAYRLLEPAFSVGQPIKLLASEGKFDDLLAQLALHRLDLVIADEPMPARVSVKAFNHPLGRSAMSFFAASALQPRLQGTFPGCLSGVPMLVPGATASVRQQLEGWFAKHQISPVVVGEFDDAALMKAFGREGQGVFLAPTALEQETCDQFAVSVVGRTTELVESFYAVSVERRITHPCVLAITDAARGQLFSV
ncbi:transcriptional activator protein NhaR [Rhodoferax lithotrophicus]|uniref:Transcriptional activator protein NhaR n=1 Tax=Rhodoferax lithotrophicus TaxID=2798804 RepID=A0ABN6D4P4_9BURK|nr:transcriptional activator NhaR [Rhodoferax sp. MIZ03]BCO25806.1 transcriptional activator protein NhaR [Rhodoferax sp. MIZ03]